MLLTSKGAAGVAGGGFIALAATLSTVGTIPPAADHADLRHRQVHVGMPRRGELHRQLRRDTVRGWWDRAVDSDRVRRVLNREPVSALPAELDATTNPLAVESTKLDDEYHPHLHHEHHAPEPRYTVEDAVRKLGPAGHTHSAPVVGDPSEPSPVLAHQPQPQPMPDGEAARHRTRPPDAARSSTHPLPDLTRRRGPAETEMKVLIAPDKFKGSLPAAQVLHHLGSGLAQRGVHHRGLPLADGGDGSVEAALEAGLRPVAVQVAAATGNLTPLWSRSTPTPRSSRSRTRAG